jgi:hypothetical protein
MALEGRAATLSIVKLGLLGKERRDGMLEEGSIDLGNMYSTDITKRGMERNNETVSFELYYTLVSYW